MTNYVFQPTQTDQTADWGDGAIWLGGVPPNSASADVVFPDVAANAGSTVTIANGEDYPANTVSLSEATLAIQGTLDVATGVTVDAGGDLILNSPSGYTIPGALNTPGLTIGPGGSFDGVGTIATAIANNGLI
jgi:hypothetical protein